MQVAYQWDDKHAVTGQHSSTSLIKMSLGSDYNNN